MHLSCLYWIFKVIDIWYIKMESRTTSYRKAQYNVWPKGNKSNALIFYFWIERSPWVFLAMLDCKMEIIKIEADILTYHSWGWRFKVHVPRTKPYPLLAIYYTLCLAPSPWLFECNLFITVSNTLTWEQNIVSPCFFHLHKELCL